MKTKEYLRKKLAHLESVNDHLYTEINYVDNLLKLVGFPEGLRTVKEAANEIINEEQDLNK